MIRVKKGVVFKAFNNQVIQALWVLQETSEGIKKDIVITSANDGKHSENSYHYKNLALDIRIRNLAQSEIGIVMLDLKRPSPYYLAEHCDVILESDHIHWEFDERRYLESLK